MNKGGQFYLVAAIIIISISVGFVIVSNYVSSEQNYNIYSLRDEISIESQKVISYTLAHSYNSNQLEGALNTLGYIYINSPSQNNWYFIFNETSGNPMIILAYQNYPATLKIYGSQQNIIKGIPYTQDFTVLGNTINVSINNYNYTLPISNINFLFIVTSKSGGQNYSVNGP